MKSDHAQELESIRKRLRATRYLLLPTFTLWPLGLFLHPLVSLLIFIFFASLTAVCMYIAFMHYLAAQRKTYR